MNIYNFCFCFVKWNVRFIVISDKMEEYIMVGYCFVFVYDKNKNLKYCFEYN